MKRPRLIVITGPTATGKTALGVALAKTLGGEVVSADSMQVYRHMDIGTAKPTADEMDGIAHHMIDIADPWEEDFSAARYVREAIPCVDGIISRGKLPIIVGGTGLYIDSLIKGRVFLARADPGLRKTLEVQFDKFGGKGMLEELRRYDPVSAERLFENDKKRIVRAFEAIKTTGIPLSLHDEEEKSAPSRYDALKVALTFTDRSFLYSKIRRRFDDMMTNDLADEVFKLLEMGVPRASTAMKAIGYKQIAEALCGEADMDTAVETAKRESTRYAKRQLTWLRRDDRINWIAMDMMPDYDTCSEKIGELFDEAK